MSKKKRRVTSSSKRRRKRKQLKDYENATRTEKLVVMGRSRGGRGTLVLTDKKKYDRKKVTIDID